MASDTVPAASDTPPQPAGPTTADAPGGQSGALSWLASAIAPIDPARPAFDLQPTTDTTSPDGSPAASSGTFHDSTDQPATTGKATTSSPKEGVARTWLRAAAERWRRGADIHVKRLEMLKAKAQAAQYKEARTVTVNRSPAPVKSPSGSGGGSSMGSKSNGSKNSRSTAGPRSGNSGGGRSGSGGSSHHGRSNSGSNSGTGSGSRHDAGRGKDTGNGRGSRSSGHGSTSGGGSNSGSSKTGKDSPSRNRDSGTGQHKSNNPGKSGGSRGSSAETATCGTGSGIDKPKKKTGPDVTGGPSSKTTGPGKGAEKGSGSSTPGSKGTTTAPGRTDTAGNKGKGQGQDRAAGKTSDGKTKNDKTPDKATTTTAGPDGKPIRTQPSREAGYRDGSRAAKVVGHVEAYKDGVKDGYRDTKQATDREKNRLDTAHQQRKQQRGKEKPVHPTATSTGSPLAGQGGLPRPVRATQITGTHVVLDNGHPQGGTQVCTRGEIRSLKSYERLLEAKATEMSRKADIAKVLEKHAHKQFNRAATLLEKARKISGGDALITDLTSLAESTAQQVIHAGELHRDAVRAAEATTSLLVNVQARYGEVYKAICNSPLTSPAELDFYNDGNTHA